MARSPSIVSDSEGKPDSSKSPEDTPAKDVDMNGDEGGEENGENGEEEEEEYEIEQILRHNTGQFEEGRMGYFVKWKGYGKEHNSWVDEQDAVNAKELLDAYWAKKKGRKSDGAAAPRKGRISTATETPEPPASSRKRGRKSQVKDEEEEEEEEKPKKKRTTRKKSQSVDPEDDVVLDSDGTPVAGLTAMEPYMSQKSWENLIQRIDTVERPQPNDDELVVYIRLKKDNGSTRVRLPAGLCNKKFPQLMIKFYESNLKWKESEVNDEEVDM